MYEMTIGELIDTLIGIRRGLGYRLWKEAVLTAWAVMGKNFPKTPEKASPELYERKKTIKMPPNLLKQHLEQMGEIKYE